MSTYRDDTPGLRAEVERLTRELAAARGVRRWAVPSFDRSDPSAGVLSALALVGAAGLWSWEYVTGSWTPMVVRFACVLAAAIALWALAFVRRVPVTGGDR